MPDDGTDECIHGIFPPTSCTICHKKPLTEDRDEHPAKTTHTAKYDGQCRACNLPIAADVTTIARHRGVWLHRKCAIEAWEAASGLHR